LNSGYLDFAAWLITIDGKINIHIMNDLVFEESYSHPDVLKWLVDLGEHHGYGRVDINTNYNQVFHYFCVMGNFEMIEWILKLSETDGYNKIDIHDDDEHIFCACCELEKYENAK